MQQKPWQAAWNKKNIVRRREWNARWIRENREKYNAAKGRYRRKLKLEGMQLYCNPVCCQKCGFANLDALVMDHINHDGAAHRKAERMSGRNTGISGTNIYELLRRKGKIEGLQVLCANFNMIKQLEFNRERSYGNIPAQ